MSRKKRAILIIIVAVVFIAIIAAIYFTRKEWKGSMGWSVDYNEESYLKGLEALEVECSKDTRIGYSYSLSSGSIELNVTSDAEGKNIIKSVQITESVSGEFTFDNQKPEIYYIFETAEEGTKASGTGEIYYRKSKWKQLVERYESYREFKEDFPNSDQ